MNHQKILVLDFGSQLTQLIARRVRECGVLCEILPCDVDPQRIQRFNASGIILSGSYQSAYHADTERAPPIVFELGLPVLGICYGMQTMAQQLGGAVQAGQVREFGHAQIELTTTCRLFEGLVDQVGDQGQSLLNVWMSHGDTVTAVPPGFKVVAATKACPIAAIADERRHFYGLQFHPEVTHTVQGKLILERFVKHVCGCAGDWNMPNFIEESVQAIRQQVGQDEVILGLSGGVDSSVAAALIHRAIGDQLTCVFVDHGLLRHQEAEQVMATFAQHLGVCVVHVDASHTFMSQLSGIIDPEQKRKIIGKAFVEVFEQEAANRLNAKWLAQGTIYPDVIESAGAKTGKATSIKSHHNVGGLPEKLHLKLLEPLRDLFKDEVRQLGVELGLHPDMVYRHPFPGPGLGVRILGEVKAEYAKILQLADAIFIEELRNTTATQQDVAAGLCQSHDVGQSWYALTSQAFAVFLPVRSVGVMGDGRTYEYVVAIRAVQTQDFMTAHWAHLPYALLGRISNRIINEVQGINRVVYDISGKPPATIEWE